MTVAEHPSPGVATANEGSTAHGSRPIRVLHLIDGLGGGGSERLLSDMVRLLPDEKYRHRIITMYPDHEDQFVYAEPLRSRGAYPVAPSSSILRWLYCNRADLMKRDSLPILRRLLAAPLLTCYLIQTTWQVTKALFGFRPHIIHVHTFYGIIYGLMIKTILRKPLVVTVPCLFDQIKGTSYGWLPWVYRHFHPWIDRFFTGASQQDLLDAGIPAGKIIDLPGVVDMEAIDKVQSERAHHRADVRKEMGLPPDVPVALSVGRLHPSKGHGYALEAIAALLPCCPNLHWLVLGEGAQRSELEALAARLGISNHVHILGFRADPLPCYTAADVYLRTGTIEGENLSSYQAMALGLPVVGFDTGRETELLKKIGHGILVANENAPALAAGMEEILKLPDRGRSLGELGQSYVREHRDIQRTLSAIAASYSQLSPLAVSQTAQ